MSAPFKIGEIVVWQNQVGEWSHLNGVEVTIIGGLELRETKEVGFIECYLTDMVDPRDLWGRTLMALPQELRHKRPPAADSHERTFMAQIHKLADKAPQKVGEPC